VGPRAVWTGAEILAPFWIRSPDHPARQCYPGPRSHYNVQHTSVRIIYYMETCETLNVTADGTHKWTLIFFFVIKPNRCTNSTNLFRHETLHVSESSSVHHQEFIHCALSNGICHTGL